MSLRSVVPDGVLVEECIDDLTSRVLPAEEAGIVGAIQARRAEFATTRLCARRALARLGFVEAAIPVGPSRQPLLPKGIVGSLTHCDGYRGSALCRAEILPALGVDAEPCRPLPDELRSMFGRTDELSGVDGPGDLDPALLLFSIKEAVYKAWNPVTGRWLGFRDVLVKTTWRDCRAGDFRADVLIAHPGEPAGFDGRFAIQDTLLFTAAWSTGCVATPRSALPQPGSDRLSCACVPLSNDAAVPVRQEQRCPHPPAVRAR